MDIERTTAIISLGKIWDNCKIIKSIISPQCHIMAVVKANAYGHGSVVVAKYLEKKGINLFFVACLSEAIELRQAGIEGEILIHCPSDIRKMHLLWKYNLTQTVATYRYAKILNELGKPIKIHLKIDTGMSRIGFYCHYNEDINITLHEIKKVSKLPNIKVCGVFTHFAESDNDNRSFTEKQFSNYTRITHELMIAGVDLGIRHCCNSTAIIKYPHMHLDMVRPGIMLYGLVPVKTLLPFKPSMELKSVIVQINDLNLGDTVSYGRTYLVQKNKKIAIVAIGYADGYFRLLSNKDSVLVKGQRAPIVGRICMDTCMIDVTDINVATGDVVTIFGKDNGQFKEITEMSDIIGTINYELLCAVNKRVRRVYCK